MKKLQTLRKSIMAEETLSTNPLLPGEIHLTMTGHHQLLVENFKGLLSFDEQQIIVQSKKDRISISGRKLQIQYYTRDEMMVVGNIEKIECKECDF
jgi:sporulation protein YqfC